MMIPEYVRNCHLTTIRLAYSLALLLTIELIQMASLPGVYQGIVALDVVQHQEALPLWSHLVKGACITSKPRENLLTHTHTCVNLLKPLFVCSLVLRTVLTLRAVALSMEFINWPELYFLEFRVECLLGCERAVPVVDKTTSW